MLATFIVRLTATAAATLLLQSAAMATPRFEQRTDVPSQIAGLSAEQTARFNHKLAQIAAMFADMSEVRSPPQPLCTRLTVSSHQKLVADSLMAESMAMGGSGVSLPAVTDGTTCSELTNNGIGVSVNSLAAAFPHSERINDVFFALPAVSSQQPGVTVLQNGKILITRPDTPFYLPVSKHQYLSWLLEQMQLQADEVVAEYDSDDMWQQWLTVDKPELIASNSETLEQMQGQISAEEFATLKKTLDQMVIDTEAGIRQLAASAADVNQQLPQLASVHQQELAKVQLALNQLTIEQRQLPACLDTEDPFSAGPEICDNGTMVIKANPALFSNAASPADIRLLFVSPGTGLHMLSFEDPRLYDLRMRIYRKVDIERLRQLLD
ncbi:hypothetical protein [Arsukibacterium sp.]|uniref:hypothetical protein n=1 Tax=Arsukibacterium sp. TaxID=1977258 RepID=UPI00299E7B94|nr:hypothetical protein [Arsukibacterium sp.]MDX1678687.1 hypothetical protein [Arsukibacterium sp.]